MIGDHICDPNKRMGLYIQNKWFVVLTWLFRIVYEDFFI